MPHAQSKKTIKKNPKTREKVVPDWKTAIFAIDEENWEHAGCAADAVVDRAVSYLETCRFAASQFDLSPDMVLAQHIKAQLTYLNAIVSS